MRGCQSDLTSLQRKRTLQKWKEEEILIESKRLFNSPTRIEENRFFLRLSGSWYRVEITRDLWHIFLLSSSAAQKGMSKWERRKVDDNTHEYKKKKRKEEFERFPAFPARGTKGKKVLMKLKGKKSGNNEENSFHSRDKGSGKSAALIRKLLGMLEKRRRRSEKGGGRVGAARIPVSHGRETGKMRKSWITTLNFPGFGQINFRGRNQGSRRVCAFINEAIVQ